MRLYSTHPRPSAIDAVKHMFSVIMSPSFYSRTPAIHPSVIYRDMLLCVTYNLTGSRHDLCQNAERQKVRGINVGLKISNGSLICELQLEFAMKTLQFCSNYKVLLIQHSLAFIREVEPEVAMR